MFGEGALYLSPVGLTQLVGGNLDATGTILTDVLPAGFNCRPALNRLVPFQALTIRSNLTLPGKFTNRASVNYLP